ncbi:SUMF1/EgtB/PvdO family nonheme iron enzyme [bacterium]|nr:SUMF1/EgtB/PvdO family nonheme iron enzyme [bacterium]
MYFKKLIWILIFLLFGSFQNAFCKGKSVKSEKKVSKESITCPDGMVAIPSRFLLYYPVFYKVNWQEVQMDTFCIDKYEYPNKKGEFPMVDVTFEKAEEICSNQGKKLCTYLEWLSACQGSKNYKYPYGVMYDPDKCNTRKGMMFFESERTLARSGDYQDCKSDFGVYDMTGNLWEWSKNIEKVKEKEYETVRELRGGAWDTGFACMDNWVQYNKANLPESFLEETFEIKGRIGFRCCQSLKK